MASNAGDVRSRALLLSVYGLVRGMNQGDLRESARLARQAIALAEESVDRALYVTVAYFSYVFTCIGECREAVAICDRAIELADGDPTVGASIVAGCPYAFCHAMKGYNLFILGEIEEARRLLEQGRKIAREQGDIETVGFIHQWSTWLACVLGEPEAALGHAQQGLEIAERIGGSFSRAYAWFFLGLAEWMRGEWRRAIEAIECSLAIARERGTAVEVDAWRLAVLGESYLGVGDAERARRLVEEGLEIARAQGHVSFEAIASLALARVLLGSAGPAARAEIESRRLSRARSSWRATWAGRRSSSWSTSSAPSWRGSPATRQPASASSARRTDSSPRWVLRGMRSGWPGSCDRGPGPLRDLQIRRVPALEPFWNPERRGLPTA
jgi:tetratricopeptide (TPR) repeat protein